MEKWKIKFLYHFLSQIINTIDFKHVLFHAMHKLENENWNNNKIFLMEDPFNELDQIQLVTAHLSFWFKYSFQGFK